MTQQINWPYQFESACVISINLDAEFRWLGQYPDLKDDDMKALTVMAKNSTTNGLPRMLALLKKHAVKGTFFVSGAFAKHYPTVVSTIAAAGHEIASLGYQDENMALLTQQQQQEKIVAAKTIIEKIIGTPIHGFRAPDGELTEETLELAKAAGFDYSSNLFSELKPFKYPLKNEDSITEIPLSWALDDLPYFIANFEPVQPAGQNRISNYQDVLTNWKYEIKGYNELHGCSVLQFNPQSIGNLGRLHIFDEVLGFVATQKNIWTATAQEVAQQI